MLAKRILTDVVQLHKVGLAKGLYTAQRLVKRVSGRGTKQLASERCRWPSSMTRRRQRKQRKHWKRRVARVTFTTQDVVTAVSKAKEALEAKSSKGHVDSRRRNWQDVVRESQGSRYRSIAVDSLHNLSRSSYRRSFVHEIR